MQDIAQIPVEMISVRAIDWDRSRMDAPAIPAKFLQPGNRIFDSVVSYDRVISTKEVMQGRRPKIEVTIRTVTRSGREMPQDMVRYYAPDRLVPMSFDTVDREANPQIGEYIN